MEVQLQKEAESVALLAAEGGAKGLAAGAPDPDDEDDSAWDEQPGIAKVVNKQKKYERGVFVRCGESGCRVGQSTVSGSINPLITEINGYEFP